MNRLLEKITEDNNVDIEDVNKIIDIEKKNVYKRKRFIKNDLRKIIEDRVSKMEESL